MKSIFVALVGFLILGSPAWAGPIAGVGVNVFPEQEGRKSDLEARLPFLVRAGYGLERIDSYLEYATFTSDDGESFVNVHRRQHSWLGFARWRFAPVGGGQITPTVALGGGLIYESVRTQAGPQTVNVDGRPWLAMALAPGAAISLTSLLDFAFEVRMTVADGLAPNPAFGATAAVGARF